MDEPVLDYVEWRNSLRWLTKVTNIPSSVGALANIAKVAMRSNIQY